ncbi:MAG: hypothetical protein J5525_13350 [Lachnospiraceae bacterium]|nr:hypothetical protein [Lachnospiraceae bacterium]
MKKIINTTPLPQYLTALIRFEDFETGEYSYHDAIEYGWTVCQATIHDSETESEYLTYCIIDPFGTYYHSDIHDPDFEHYIPIKIVESSYCKICGRRKHAYCDTWNDKVEYKCPDSCKISTRCVNQ